MTLSIASAAPAGLTGRHPNALMLRKPTDLEGAAGGSAPATEAISVDKAGSPAAAKGDKAGGKNADAAIGSQGRRVVDQRVTEAGDVRITVISYSDGSSETLTAIRGGGRTEAKPSQKPSTGEALGKGMFVDRTA